MLRLGCALGSIAGHYQHLIILAYVRAGRTQEKWRLGVPDLAFGRKPEDTINSRITKLYAVYGKRTFSRPATSSARFSFDSLSRFCWRHLTAGKLAAPGTPRRSQSGWPRSNDTRNFR